MDSANKIKAALDGALAIVRRKLSSFPDHGARDGVAVYKITGAELGAIEDALAQQAGDPKPLLVEFDRETGYLKDPVETGEPKPVAWRWRHTAKTYGHDCEAPGPWHGGKSPYSPGEAWRYEEQPLFTHPPKADPDVVRLVEAARRLRRQVLATVSPAPEVIDAAAQAAAALAPFSALGEG